jgi:hypothetical protein
VEGVEHAYRVGQAGSQRAGIAAVGVQGRYLWGLNIGLWA